MPGCARAIQVSDAAAGKLGEVSYLRNAVRGAKADARAPVESKASWFDEGMKDPHPVATKPSAQHEDAKSANSVSNPSRPRLSKVWSDGSRLRGQMRGLRLFAGWRVARGADSTSPT